MTLSHISNRENLFLPIACDRESERLMIFRWWISLTRKRLGTICWQFFVTKHLQQPLRALPDKAFSDQKCTKCRPPGPAGGVYSSPQTPSCIETPRTFGVRSSIHAFGIRRQSVPVLLFSHSNTGYKVSDYNFKTSAKFNLIKINSVTEMNNKYCNNIQQSTLIDVKRNSQSQIAV